MEVDYEEKSFESALNHELLGSSPLLYAPGQVLELVLGIDAGLFVENPGFWKWWPGLGRNGVFPSHKPAPPFPSFRLNVFLQHKRPEYLTAANAKEWRYWNQAYFRYRLTTHQQAALEAGAAAVAKAGLVAYACPALETAAKLFDAIASQCLVDATNFVDVARLHGHTHYTFIAAGIAGWACSEPERVEPLSLTDTLRDRLIATTEEPLFTVAERAATAMLLAHPSLRGRVDRLHQHIRDAVEFTPQTVRERLRKLLFVAEACQCLGITWVVAALGERHEPE